MALTVTEKWSDVLSSPRPLHVVTSDAREQQDNGVSGSYCLQQDPPRRFPASGVLLAAWSCATASYCHRQCRCDVVIQWAPHGRTVIVLALRSQARFALACRFNSVE